MSTEYQYVVGMLVNDAIDKLKKDHPDQKTLVLADSDYASFINKSGRIALFIDKERKVKYIK